MEASTEKFHCQRYGTVPNSRHCEAKCPTFPDLVFGPTAGASDLCRDCLDQAGSRRCDTTSCRQLSNYRQTSPAWMLWLARLGGVISVRSRACIPPIRAIRCPMGAAYMVWTLGQPRGWSEESTALRLAGHSSDAGAFIILRVIIVVRRSLEWGIDKVEGLVG